MGIVENDKEFEKIIEKIEIGNVADVEIVDDKQQNKKIIKGRSL